ncbi:MAG: 2-C-methyl-D-erythritol 4-phosphate cytidylyltransferase [Oscillospiraceae bacterium]|nr:2-C-methyl-D-erythritol 4-phosphate cytidylyltransferase [Oscillospiraceae bacterium]
MDTSVIIVSAGSSTRMQGQNKQLALVGGIPVAARSMMAFERCESVAEIIVVTRTEDIETMKQLAEQYNITKLSCIVSGGNTRQESVLNGVRKISDGTKMIAVHDGARPLVTPENIERTIADARVFSGAVLGVPVKDTIKTVSDGLITDTPPRSSLYITQTPQVFKRSVYLRAVEFASRNYLDFTDDCQLAEAIGVKVCMTTGDYKNIKITTPEDIAIAEAILNS